MRQRGSLRVWFTDEAIKGWRAEPRTTPGGQPWYSSLTILTALTLRAVFQLALRQTEGLIGSVIGLLGLVLAVPDHTTLSRRAPTLEVPRPRPRKDGEPMHLLVDSTGLKLCGKGEWLLEKHGTATRRSWRALHLGVDAGTGRNVAATLSAKDVDDASQVDPLLDQVAGLWRLSRATAPTTRTAFTPVSPSAILTRSLSSRRARTPCRARRPRAHRGNGTATSSTLPGTGA